MVESNHSSNPQDGNSGDHVVRLGAAAVSDVDAIRRLEVAAGAPFAEIGMHDIAEADPPSPDEIRRAIEQDRLLLASDDAGLAGFIMWSRLDEETHIDQVSVAPRAAGRRIGKQLIDHVCTLAAAAGDHAVTLTTFSEVAWNAPLYERYGFQVVEAEAMGPELAECRRQEIVAGLDASPRVAMRRVL